MKMKLLEEELVALMKLNQELIFETRVLKKKVEGKNEVISMKDNEIEELKNEIKLINSTIGHLYLD